MTSDSDNPPKKSFSAALAGALVRTGCRVLRKTGNAPAQACECGIWAPDYERRKRSLIQAALANADLMSLFRQGKALPAGYGTGTDERCVEYPWFFLRLQSGAARLLDAGSTLNHDYILDHPPLREKMIHIITLVPEATCAWSKGIGYLFHDLRDIPIRDSFYDVAACLSTLEHVGCDNTAYTGQARHGEQVLDAFEQKDCRYVEWLVLPPEKWPSAKPIEPDHAVAARAVACVQLTKA